MIKASIIGMGIVGTALAEALAKKGVSVSGHDPPAGLDGSDGLADADYVFVCVPTPYSIQGKGVNLEHVRDALGAIPGNGRITLIRSTILPGTTDALQDEYPQLALLHHPEFLTEARAMEDEEKPARQIIGIPRVSLVGPANHVAWTLLKSVLPEAPFQAVIPSMEAELTKYFANGFYALKVAFANQFHDHCLNLNADYEMVRVCAESDPMMHPNHININHAGYRGYGGKCLPKDVAALLNSDDEGVLSILHEANAYNAKLKKRQKAG